VKMSVEKQCVSQKVVNFEHLFLIVQCNVRCLNVSTVTTFCWRT